ncbi:MAG: hypothetical protein GY826_13590, partial [Fuerstiella sp.]|nr:hypothetical protein [Fuerstiella sp.]
NLNGGFGVLSDRQATLCLNGSLSPELGFQGNVTCRIADPHGTLLTKTETIRPLSPLEKRVQLALAEDDRATYIVLRGQKRDSSVRTEYGKSSAPGLVSLVTPAEMKSAEYLIKAGNRGIVADMHVGSTVARLKATVSLDILAPAGTAASPNDFRTTNVYTFVDDRGTEVGSVTASVETG